MKLEKAIEILKLNALEEGCLLPSDYITALKLNIEAATFVESLKQVAYPHTLFRPPVLPGETIEELEREI